MQGGDGRPKMPNDFFEKTFARRRKATVNVHFESFSAGNLESLAFMDCSFKKIRNVIRPSEIFGKKKGEKRPKSILSLHLFYCTVQQ